jgi:hypothetical protein
MHSRWVDMVCRCESPNAVQYPHYGGRGITVDPRWRHSFETFYTDVGDPPFQGATLDRIDNNLGYAPENVRWSAPGEQSNNQRILKLIAMKQNMPLGFAKGRRGKVLSFNGRSQTAAQWAKEKGTTYSTLYGRLKRGWSLEETLTIPVISQFRSTALPSTRLRSPQAATARGKRGKRGKRSKRDKYRPPSGHLRLNF